MLATESDEATRQSVIQKVMSSGLSYMVPAVQSFDVSLDASANQNRQIVLNASNGKSLMAVFSAVAHLDDQKGLQTNVSDPAGTLLFLTKRLAINNSYLTNELQSPAQYYQQNYKYFEDSLINSEKALGRHLVWAQNFSGVSFPELAESNANLSGGLDLVSGPLSVTVDFTKNAATRYHWLFALVTRYFSMTPTGPIVSNVPLA